ncbi:MAG: PQQ-binding-like beta-propeller repeat protein [Myxococcota bacterium]|jgi:hypothetical protein|nr:PQQ-binding-like beta-propeller repeat protein [Myxococcota bacterium]
MRACTFPDHRYAASSKRIGRFTTLSLSVTFMALLAACGPNTAVQKRSGLQSQADSPRETLKVSLPSGANWQAVAIWGDDVYALSYPDDASMVGALEYELSAFERGSGKQEWNARFKLSSSLSVYYTSIVATPEVVLFRSDYTVAALSARDGSMLWSVDDNANSMMLLGFDDQYCYVFSYPSTIKSYALADGKEGSTWDFSNFYLNECWMGQTGLRFVCSGQSMSSGDELIVVALDSTSQSGPQEIFRAPYYGYDSNSLAVGPVSYNSSGMPSYGRSDYVAKVTTGVDSAEIEVYSIAEPGAEPIWQKRVDINPNDYYSSAYYAPKLLLSAGIGLTQQPNSTGVLLSSVLRLQLLDFSTAKPFWTSVLPINDYIDSIRSFGNRVLIHTRNDMGSDRWYAFDRDSGELLWSSEQSSSAPTTRSMAVHGNTLVRLTTLDWVQGELLIDTLP